MAENLEFVNVDESYKFSAINNCEEYDHVKKCVLKLEAEVESLKKVDGKVASKYIYFSKINFFNDLIDNRLHEANFPVC